MKQILNIFYCALAAILCTLTSRAEMTLARISDKDGYVNIRNGQGNNFDVVGTIKTDEFFYAAVSDSDWWEILSLQWKYSTQVKGYVHKSRIQIIEWLSLKEQKKIIDGVFYYYMQFRTGANKHYDTVKLKQEMNDDTLRSALSEEGFYINDTKYDPILSILPKYICQSKDTSTLQLFFSLLWEDRGSANESPSYSLGDSYIC